MIRKILAATEDQVAMLEIQKKMAEAESYKMMAHSFMLDEDSGSAQWKEYRNNYLYWVNEYSKWAHLFRSLTKILK